MTSRELISSNNWFSANPDKVLGEQYATTNQFGENVTLVKKTGSVEDIANKIIDGSFVPEPQQWVINVNAAKEVDKIAEAIKKTKEQISNPPDLNGLDMIGFDELQRRYGGDITEEEYTVWVWYQMGKSFKRSAISNPANGWNKFAAPVTDAKITEWVTNGLLCFDGIDYYPPSIFYHGNIYDRINKLKFHSEAIIDKFSEAVYNEQLSGLESARPTLLKLDAPEDERLFISPLDPFVTDTFIGVLSDGTVFDEETSLFQAFKEYMRSVSDSEFKNGSNSYEINNYYLGNERFPRDTEPAIKIETKRRAQSDGLYLFGEFLSKMLSREDQQIISYKWNSIYNNWREFNYARIPVGFEINRYFKNAPIDPRPSLWDGVKFMNIAGSGGIAFDVGVGKTMTAILAVAQALYTGQCKRPLIVVPNPTYKKWIIETIGQFDENGKVLVHGVLPQYKDRINDFYNLGVEKIGGLPDIWPKDYTITFITYEGLERIGFGESARAELEVELLQILNQGDLKERDVQKLREDVDKILGGITSDTVANIDDLGFDYIVVDEAHNFKKIFTRVKGRSDDEGEQQNTPYQLSSGSPSSRGLKLFAISQYILRNNNMRNVALLTATPFTNSPLEIYSMLSLVAYQHLERRGIINLIDFFDKFINEEPELVVTIRGRYETRPVIKTFNNRQVLQNIIFSSFLYKTGEEAGVPRPIKIVYPLIKDSAGLFLPPEKRVETSLQATRDQSYWMREIARFANEEPNAIEPFVPDSFYDDKDRLLGRDLIAISLGQSVTLTPYLLRIGGEGGVNLFESEPPTYKDFIESSPKLHYTCLCCKSVREWHLSKNESISGQVIYMNRATNYFPLIKEYLITECGFEASEVEIISGEISKDKKERIKERFLTGIVKIIIGSATIKEGIDLQNKSTVLYNCNLDWNPTDIQQLEGRIWRQGNQHSYVRIVTPMVENSLDVFLFQKLEEKTSRINDLWYRKGRGNVLKIEDFDPKELKLGLMTDPDERVRAEIKLDISKFTNQKKIHEGTIEKISEAQDAITDITVGWERINIAFPTCESYLKRKIDQIGITLENKDINGIKKVDSDRLELKRESLSRLLSQELNDKVKLAIVKRYAKEVLNDTGGGYNSEIYSLIRYADDQLKKMGILESVHKNILAPKGLTIADDLEPIIIENEGELEKINEEIKKLSSQEYFDTQVAIVVEEMNKKKLLSKSIPERVTEFKKQNYLLSCLKNIHDCNTQGNVKTLKTNTPPAPIVASDKDKRLRIAKAKAQALILKLKLAA